MKNMLNTRLDQHEKFHSDLETKKTSFSKRNRQATEMATAIEEKDELP